MPSYKKSPVSKPLIILGAMLAAAIGYYVNGAWHKGIEIKEFYDNLMLELSYPLRDYYDDTTIKAVLISLLIYAVLMVMYISSRRNLMHGMEFGTARFSSIDELNAALKALKRDAGAIYWILSESIRMNLVLDGTMFNNNILVIGGSGSGKTFTWVFPNMMQCGCSFIVTDPKGEIFRIMGRFLKLFGYRVRVLNLQDMKKSDGYNPFVYIESDEDVRSAVETIVSSTNPPNAQHGEPFWENSEKMDLMSIFEYVWRECPPVDRHFGTVTKLLLAQEIHEDGQPSEYDLLMEDLAATSPLGKEHPAYKYYSMCMKGAPDTIRSIVITASARMSLFMNESVLSILDHDDMNLRELGAGVNGDKKTKTALFCLISDSDPTYNFIVSMLYLQAFKILYRTADFEYGGKLPIHVAFILDEFANIQLPDNFTSLISTMRSREISSVVIIQGLKQLEAMYKDKWEHITSNCDTMVYLGGNEKTTWEYVSGILGKTTIEKKSTSSSRGGHGSDSQSYDVLQRDVLTPDEVGRLPNNKCIIKVKGMNAIIDNKYNTKKHPHFKLAFGKKPDMDDILPDSKNRYSHVRSVEFLNDSSIEYFEKRAKRDERNLYYIDSLTLDEFLSLDELTFRDRILDLTDMDEVRAVNEREGLGSSLQYMPESAADSDEESEQLKLVNRLIRQAKSKTSYEHEGSNQGQGSKIAFIPSRKAASS